MRIKTIVILCCMFLCVSANAQKKIQLSSPDGRILFSFFMQKNKPFYTVSYNKKELLKPSSLNLVFEDGAAFENCSINPSPVFSKGVENYKLVVGKASSVNEAYNKVIIFLSGITGAKYNVNLEVKAFNDGVAFRFVFPLQNNKVSYTLLEEETQFNFAGNPVVKALLLPDYFTAHEGLYTTTTLNQLKEDTLADMPALFQCDNNTFVAITEAALLDYAGMYLVKHNGVITSQLSPLPGQTSEKVKAKLPHQTPWRVLMISDRIGALIESNILTNLCPPSAIDDVSWIKTGTTTFPWWNGTIIPDTTFAPGNNFETNKYYIDFCAANNVLYHSVVEGGGHEWYTNDGAGYQPGKNFDVTKPVHGINMKKICDYAKSKNVEVRVWVHWKALYAKLDTAFALFEKWGLSGMMVDFMDRDDQEMINIQTEILQKAAKHHLHIQFHGVHKPTGLSRTYPNEFTREGVMNYEYNKWSKLITPDEDINIPFTRLLAGSTDYHLGGFRAATTSSFKIQFTRPLVVGTRCHMLAMYVVLENAQGMLCDYPEAYINQPGFEVLHNIPTTWDETHVPTAAIDKYVSIARRKGDDWYIGTISNNEERELNIDLGFLPAGSYTAEIYNDAADAALHPDNLKKERKTLNNSMSAKIKMAAGGGNVIFLHKN